MTDYDPMHSSLSKEDVASQLEHTAETCLDLAKRLSSSGRHLTDREIEFIRFSYLSAAREITFSLLQGFILGDDRILENASEELHRLNHGLNQL